MKGPIHPPLPTSYINAAPPSHSRLSAILCFYSTFLCIVVSFILVNIFYYIRQIRMEFNHVDSCTSSSCSDPRGKAKKPRTMTKVVFISRVKQSQRKVLGWQSQVQAFLHWMVRSTLINKGSSRKLALFPN